MKEGRKKRIVKDGRERKEKVKHEETKKGKMKES
jgi:hypothetical protein